MYQIALAVQITSIIICAVGTFFLYNRIDKAVSKNLLASCLFAIIFGVGYLMEMMAKNAGEASYAIIVQYIGLAFVALFFAVFSNEFFNFFKTPKAVWDIIFYFNLSTFISVLTSGYHNYYYKARVFVENGLYPHLETTNAPWFYAFMVVLMLCMIYSTIHFLIAMIKAFKKKYLIMAFIALIFGVGVMWISFGVGFNGYEPISATVCTILGVVSFIMMGSKNSSIINKAYHESYMNSAIGQIIVTKDYKYLECNKIAKEFFPPLKNYQREQPLKIEGEGFVFNSEESKLHVGDRCYAITSQDLEQTKLGHDGKIISMTDVTTLENQRIFDNLTGLLNRQGFFDKISEILTKSPERIDVLIADLNGLKTTNDTHGHGEGDKLIKSAAACLKEAFNSKSYIFRFGGDEFVVVSIAGENQFETMNRNLERIIKRKNIGSSVPVSISCGTSYALSSDGIDIDKMMKAADTEMYLNKKKYYESNHIERRHV